MLEKNIGGSVVTDDQDKIILEKIKKYISSPQGFFHIVSLNPENIVLAREDKNFREIVTEAQITIPDGVGVVWAAHLLGLPLKQRIAGVDLMDKLVRYASENSLPVILIGAKDNLAEELAECYRKIYGQIKITGLQGIKYIANPHSIEEERIFSIVTDMRPCLLFAAFGSPAQEKWFWKNQSSLTGCVCMGVGGAFDLRVGTIHRAPQWIQHIGLEWLFRLLKQPWRWRRQLRLVKFIWLVLLQRFSIVK